MRISDWSSDVCSSDLLDLAAHWIADPGGGEIAVHRPPLPRAGGHPGIAVAAHIDGVWLPLHRLGGILLILEPVARLDAPRHEHHRVGRRRLAKRRPLPLVLREPRESEFGGNIAARIRRTRPLARIVPAPPARAPRHIGKGAR